MKDYYEVLGVNKNATEKEIKSAYRKQALKWHPDKNKSKDAEKRFKEINEAYQVLSDKQKRQMYDQYGHAGVSSNGPAGGAGRGAAGGYSQQGPFRYYTNMGSQGFDFDFEGMDPFDIFEQFFGFRNAGGRAQRQRRSVFEMHLTFNEAVKGVTKRAVIGGKERTIKVPAGVGNGSHIRFDDFDIVVRVEPDQHFKREGQDVYVEETISFPQAALGDTINVKTIDSSVKMKVRAGTQPNSVVRLREKGIPYPNSSRRGDQYVVIKVKVPEKLSGKAKKLMEELKREL